MPVQGSTAPTVPPAPPPPPAAQGTPTLSTPDGQLIAGGASANAVYEAQRAARRELRSQLEQLESRREELADQLRDPMVTGVDKTGLEARIKEVDARISALEGQIVASDAAVAQAAAVPGAVVPDRPPVRTGPPEEVFVLGGMFIVFALFPLSIAYARRIWRRSAGTLANLPKELAERFTRLEQAVDAIAVEVERVGEGQRFLTRTMTEANSRALGAGQQPMEPVAVRDRETVHARSERGPGR
jgi:hypothetical protein